MNQKEMDELFNTLIKFTGFICHIGSETKMPKDPQFIREMKKKIYEGRLKEEQNIERAWREWNRVLDTLKKFPGFRPTEERRAPKKDEWFLADHPFPIPLQAGFDWNEIWGERFILEKIEYCDSNSDMERIGHLICYIKIAIEHAEHGHGRYLNSAKANLCEIEKLCSRMKK